MTPRKMILATIACALAALPLAASAHGNHDDEKTVKVEKKELRAEKRGWLGVRLQRLEGGIAEALNLDEDSGVLLGQVMEGSPAEKAGLRAGDIVVSVDKDEVGSPTELRDAVAGHDPGDRITVHYLRDGRSKRAGVTLGEAPAPRSFAGRQVDRARHHVRRARDLRFTGQHGFLGVMTQPLDGDLAEYFGAKDGGALVSEVVEDSPAQKLGLKAGDVIVRVGDEGVSGPADLRRAIGRHDDEREVEIAWIREKRERKGTAKLEVREGPGISGLGRREHFLDEDFAEGMAPELRRHAGAARILARRFHEDGGLHEMVEELKLELKELRKEMEDLKSD